LGSDFGRILSKQDRLTGNLFWGHVFCRLDPASKHDWLVVIYNPFTNVPLSARSIEMLFAHEPITSDED